MDWSLEGDGGVIVGVLGFLTVLLVALVVLVPPGNDDASTPDEEAPLTTTNKA